MWRVGAFNNGWSLRLTRPLRYSLALDSDTPQSILKDAQIHPHDWELGDIKPSPESSGLCRPPCVLQDYASCSDYGTLIRSCSDCDWRSLHLWAEQVRAISLRTRSIRKLFSRVRALENRHRNHCKSSWATTVPHDCAGPLQGLCQCQSEYNTSSENIRLQ